MSPLLALLAFQAAVVDPVKDPALAKPVTLRLSMTPLRAVVAALAKETGQPLAVAGALTDLKATVLVKALPAGRTMEALADALGMVWKKDGEILRLGRPDGSAAAESGYLAYERSLGQKSVGIEPGPSLGGAANRRQRPGRPGRTGRPPGGEPGSTAAPLRFDPTLLAMEGGGAPAPSRLEPSTPRGDSPFAKAAAAWPSLPEKIDDAWRAPISPRFGKSAWEGNLYSVGDVLAAWHDASGLPVVADAFRIPTKTTGLGPGTAMDVLQYIAAGDGLALRLANGVARLRHPAFWRLREQEVPETKWSTLERGALTIDSLAAFAAGLSASQAAAFRSVEAPLSHVKTSALRESYPALLLWNVLPPAARKSLLNEAPVGLAAVRNAAGAYLFALREAPYYRAGDPSEVLAMPPAQIGIFGKTTAKAVQLRLSGERGGGVTYFVTLQ